MKELRLKDEYKGMIITRNHMLVGNVTFDSTRVAAEQYANFQNIFPDLFESVEICDVCSNEDCICEESVEISEESPKEEKEDYLESFKEVKKQVRKYTKK